VDARSYRADIDGLRAFSVLAVLAFHAFPARFPGGFLGVDVFFTISGFVITRQILAEFSLGEFRLSVFYYRRFRRIFPALLVTMVAVVLGGVTWMLASELQRLAGFVVSATLFSANLYSWAVVDYFGPAAISQPLLHLWSLGIEEQFYAVWPLLLYWAYRRDWTLSLTLVLLLVSLAAWLLIRVDDVAGAFYLPQYRAWELLAGCLPAVLEARQGVARNPRAEARQPTDAVPLRHRTRWSGGCEELVCAASAAALLWLVSGLNVPAEVLVWRLPLVIGLASLLLARLPQARLTGGLLGMSWPRYIGRISFPLYLTHWPLLSFGAIVCGELDKWQRLALLALAFLLAVLLYHAVETPIRRRTPSWPLARTLSGALAALAVLVVVLATVRAGVEDPRERFIADAERAAQKDAYGMLTHVECGFIDPATGQGRQALPAQCLAAAPGGWMLWGDSHAQQLRHGLETLLPSGTPLSQVATQGCAARWIAPTDPEGTICDRANRFALAEIARRHPRVVVVAERDRYLEADWPALQSHLAALGVAQFVVVGQVPQWTRYLPRTLAFRWQQGIPERLAEQQVAAPFREDLALRGLLDHHAGLRYVSMVAQFCRPEGCLVSLPEGAGRVLTTLDYGHLTLAASRFAASAILAQVPEH
jgi:peptidoglycan/LPS O-acetylase OafA/YrhL